MHFGSGLCRMGGHQGSVGHGEGCGEGRIHSWTGSGEAQADWD